jgi:hypothetical protein
MMSDRYAAKYNATAFDPTDPNEALAERARLALIEARMNALLPDDDLAPRQQEYLFAGLLVGIVQVMQANSASPQDRTDAAIRASLIQTAAWAVDTARAMQGLDPLPDGQ